MIDASTLLGDEVVTRHGEALQYRRSPQAEGVAAQGCIGRRL